MRTKSCGRCPRIMTKTELLKNLAESSGLNRDMLEVVFGKTIKAIEETLMRGEQVSIPDFGTFSVKTRKAREGRNPRTGEPLLIPESRVVAFKAARGLRERFKTLTT